MFKGIRSDQRGMLSIPIIIGIVTVVVFVGIVIAAIKQEQRNPIPSTNPELESQLEEEPLEVTDFETATTTATSTEE